MAQISNGGARTASSWERLARQDSFPLLRTQVLSHDSGLLLAHALNSTTFPSLRPVDPHFLPARHPAPSGRLLRRMRSSPTLSSPSCAQGTALARPVTPTLRPHNRHPTPCATLCAAGSRSLRPFYNAFASSDVRRPPRPPVTLLRSVALTRTGALHTPHTRRIEAISRSIDLCR